MEAECTVSGTANCAGLSVPNFMLRQEESSSCSCMLLLSPLDSSTQSSARILPSYMEAECTVSGTANCAGLSVPNFMLRQEESSSCSCMLLLNTLQTPFPLRLLHPSSARILPSYMEAECTVSGTANCAGILFRWINSSASQAT